ncbi:hypothetical protein EI42_01039 [Thermosporothrix hazakensis]|uniref:Small integral membrane protein DUF2273 n=2 Tax=Thermosporothrix TaxID=768650 RepID=A0A326UX44_THEHA|nr:hypothetical protein EI42_01039 [Thermosporothrix hazakensis]
MSGRTAGLLFGFGLGVVWMWLGFWPAVLTLILGVIGWLIGGVAEGKVNLADVWSDLQGRRREV